MIIARSCQSGAIAQLIEEIFHDERVDGAQGGEEHGESQQGSQCTAIRSHELEGPQGELETGVLNGHLGE